MKDDRTSISLDNWHRGDEKARDALVANNLDWIHKRVRERLGSLLKKKGETCDYVQEAMVQFLQYGPRFTISSEEGFRGLMLKIVENMLCNKYDWFTARRREIARERPLPSDTVLNLDPPRQAMATPSKSAEKNEQEAWVRLGLEFVKSEDREVLILRQWDGLTFDEIGERLGISSSAAQSRHFRALDRLGTMVSALRRGDLDGL